MTFLKKKLFFYETILAPACRSGNIDLVKYLISLKKIHVASSILYDACMSNNLELVKYLMSLKKIDVDELDVYFFFF